MKKLALVLSFLFVFSLVLTVSAFADISFGANIRVDDSTSGIQQYSSIAIDTTGNIYIAWIDWRNGGGTDADIYFAKSTDGGASFGANVRIDDGTPGHQFFPSIAVDTNGNIDVAWEDYRNGASPDIYFAKSTDGGASFGVNIRVDDSTAGGQEQPSLAVDTSGNVYIAWYDTRNSGSPDIYFAKSTDGGASFGANVRVDDGTVGAQYFPSIAVDTNGNIDVAWQDSRNGSPDIYFAKSDNGGASFGVNIRVDDGASGDKNFPSIAVDTNGNIYVAWHDDRNGGGNYDIFFAKSTDGGASFGANVRVDDSTTTGNQRYPSLAVDTNGNVYVAWYDSRNGGTYDIYFAQSTNGGASFGVNIRVDDSTAGGQEHPSLAVDTSGNVYVVWEDGRSGNPDIYFAKGTYIPPNVPPVANAGEDQVASVADMVTLDGSASYDPDGTIASYTWKSLSDYGNTVIGTTQTCQVMARGYAEELIELTVTDNDGVSSTDTMIIRNSRINLLPPLMAAISDKSTAVNQNLQFSVSATDPEGFNLAYSANNLPSGASFNPNTRIFSWTPTLAQGAKTYVVNFSVNDGFFTDSQNVRIVVIKPKSKPRQEIAPIEESRVF